MITSIAVSIEKSNIIGRPPVMRFRSLRHGATNGSVSDTKNCMTRLYGETNQLSTQRASSATSIRRSR